MGLFQPNWGSNFFPDFLMYTQTQLDLTLFVNQTIFHFSTQQCWEGEHGKTFLIGQSLLLSKSMDACNVRYVAIKVQAASWHLPDTRRSVSGRLDCGGSNAWGNLCCNSTLQKFMLLQLILFVRANFKWYIHSWSYILKMKKFVFYV